MRVFLDSLEYDCTLKEGASEGGGGGRGNCDNYESIFQREQEIPSINVCMSTTCKALW